VAHAYNPGCSGAEIRRITVLRHAGNKEGSVGPVWSLIPVGRGEDIRKR
jgi:hypothetical protein